MMIRVYNDDVTRELLKISCIEEAMPRARLDPRREECRNFREPRRRFYRFYTVTEVTVHTVAAWAPGAAGLDQT